MGAPSPWVHNFLVNVGLKNRGLCYHGAEDLHARLNALGCRTLEFRFALASAMGYDEHTALVVIVRGGAFGEGVGLDPWRESLPLYWVKLKNDPKYRWLER